MFLLAIFIPPIYFLAKGKPIGFIATFLFFLLGIYLCSTILLAPLILVFWVIASVWACYDLRWDVKREDSPSGTVPGKKE